MTYTKIFNGTIINECYGCPYRLNYSCRHPESPSKMGRVERMSWICDERGKAVFPNDCPLETATRQMPTKEDIEKIDKLLEEIGE